MKGHLQVMKIIFHYLKDTLDIILSISLCLGLNIQVRPDFVLQSVAQVVIVVITWS